MEKEEEKEEANGGGQRQEGGGRSSNRTRETAGCLQRELDQSPSSRLLLPLAGLPVSEGHLGLQTIENLGSSSVFKTPKRFDWLLFLKTIQTEYVLGQFLAPWHSLENPPFCVGFLLHLASLLSRERYQRQPTQRPSSHHRSSRSPKACSDWTSLEPITMNMRALCVDRFCSGCACHLISLGWKTDCHAPRFKNWG